MGRVIMKLHVPREEHLESICWKERGRTIIFSLIVREAIAEMQKKQEQERKEFMKPVITPSGEDYLEAVLVLQQKQGMVRSVDVARHLEVTKPSVCHAVATLRDGGFLTQRLFPASDRCGPGSGGADLRKAPLLYRPADRGRRRPGNGGKGRLPDGACHQPGILRASARCL